MRLRQARGPRRSATRICGHRRAPAGAKLPASIAGTKIIASCRPPAQRRRAQVRGRSRSSPQPTPKIAAPTSSGRSTASPSGSRKVPPSGGRDCAARSGTRAGDRDCAGEHECQLRIEVAVPVEKSQHDETIGHPRDREPKAEQRARSERRDDAPVHGSVTLTWRTMNTVAIAVSMKVSTAASDRHDSRPRPQTPCPLVQPLPMRVPKPTRNPASSRSGVEADCGRGGHPAGTASRRHPPPSGRAGRRRARRDRPRRRPEAVDDAADAGDAPDRPEEQRRRQADQRAARSPYAQVFIALQREWSG